jgi:hypothetical protein
MEAEADVTPTSLPAHQVINRRRHALSIGAHLIDPCTELETKGQGAFR